MKRYIQFPIFILFLILIGHQIINSEVPDPDYTVENGNELIYLEQDVPLDFYYTNNGELSSIGLKLSLFKSIERLKDRLIITIELDNKSVDQVVINIPLIKLFLNNEVRIPLDGFSTGDKEYHITLKTTAPDFSLGIYYHPDRFSDIDHLSYPEQIDITGYRKFSIINAIAFLPKLGPSFFWVIKILLLISMIGVLILQLLLNTNLNLWKEFIYAPFYGLAVLPLLGVGVYYFGFNPNLTLFSFLMLSIALLIKFRKKSVSNLNTSVEKKAAAHDIFDPVILVVVSVIGSLILNRHNIVAPWVDGIKHQAIISSLLEHTRNPIFSGYHIGFHLSSTLLTSIGILKMQEVSLILGQAIYALSGLSIYLFIKELTKNRRLSFFSALIFSLCLPFPMYLQNWARYPFLLSIVLLLPLCTLIYRWLFNKEPVRLFILLLSSGLVLIHYGSIFLIATFFLACIGMRILNKRDRSFLFLLNRKSAQFFLLLFVSLLFIILSLWKGLGLEQLIEQQKLEFYDPLLDIGKLFKGFGFIYFSLALAGWAVVLEIKERYCIFNLWILNIILGSVLQLCFFRTLLFRLINVLVVFSIFFAFYSASFLIKIFDTRNICLSKKTAYLLVISLLLWCGFTNSFILLSPSVPNFNTNDKKAMEWIIDNTNEADLFLINSFIWGNELISYDAGGWIPYVTGRRNVLLDVPLSEDELCESIPLDSDVFYYEGDDYLSLTNIDPILEDMKVVYRDGVKIFSIKKNCD